MKLFDDFVTTDDLPRQPGEPSYNFLNRSNWPSIERVRDVLQQWLNYYPIEEQIDLVTRFRSPERIDHSSSFFELLLHELLRLQGCRLTPHPTLPASNKKVDFLVEEPSGYQFYLEATVVDDGSKAKADARLEDLKRRINEQLDNKNFFISLSLHGDVRHPLPSATKIVQFLKERLDGLDPDAVGAVYETKGYDAFTWPYEDEKTGFTADFQPIPRKASVRGTKPQQPLGMTTSAFWQANDTQRLQDSIDDKSNRYGEPDLPFVVAINNIHDSIDHIDVVAALYGTDRIKEVVECFGAGKPTPYWIGEGAFVGRKGPRRRRLSGVITVNQLLPFHLAPMKLFRNPFAARPLGFCCLDLLTSYTLIGEQLEPKEGKATQELLDLPEGWPTLGQKR